MRSIQSKFLTIIITGMLAIALCISVVSLFYIENILKVDSDIITESVANTEQLRLNDKLREVENAAYAMEKYVNSTLANLHQLSDYEFLNTYLVSAKKTFSAIVNSGDGTINAFFLRFAPEYAFNTAGFFISRSAGGKSFYEFAPKSLAGWEEQPYEDICWYSEPKLKGRACWIDPYFKSENTTTTVTYTIPLFIDYKFIGVVGVDMDFSVITGMVGSISVYDNGFAYVTDEKMKELYFAPVDQLELHNSKKNGEFAEEHKLLRNGMTLVIHADYRDIQRDGYRMLTDIMVLTIIFIVSFILIIFIVTKRITRPLRKLTLAAEKLGDGTVELDLEKCKTKDEVGVLARAFEKTAESLRGYISYVNALAYRDSLTGVKNSTAYSEQTNELDLSMKKGEVEPFGIFVADMNGLKNANDSYGHEFGNKLIFKTARLICDVFKHSPVYRIGGDEFAVLLKGDDFARRDELLAELDERSANAVVIDGDNRFPVSFARAIAVYDEELDDSVDSVFDRADKKMYAHKDACKRDHYLNQVKMDIPED